MQPTHATSDMSYAERRLVSHPLSHFKLHFLISCPKGHERIKGAYAWQSLSKYVDLPLARPSSHTTACRRAGVRLALGSDAPVESLDPLKGFYAAVTRLWPDGDSPHGSNGW